MYHLCRGVNLTLRMLQDVFQLDRGLGWVEPTQLAFIILGASMAALALMILVVAILATGATRHEVYQTSGGRAGGRIGKEGPMQGSATRWSPGCVNAAGKSQAEEVGSSRNTIHQTWEMPFSRAL